MAIKMRVNKYPDSFCMECDTGWMHTPEMYDFHICGETYTICASCMDRIFHKALKAGVMYNQRLKSKTDMKRIRNSKKADPMFGKHMSIAEALRGIGEE